jgi:uncharacterized glyoxalase superfamily protein PhnB/uncharacterized protein YndB with AHSA1/START domain
MTNETVFEKDLQNKKLTITRTFNAPPDLVWSAWTESEILDKWWAPKPYRAETKSLDLRTGGAWIYAMVSPEGERQWCKVDFKTVAMSKAISSDVYFCDEQGNMNTEFPVMHWLQEFNGDSDITIVKVIINFDNMEDLEKIVGMGFKEGFASAHTNLDQYISTQFKLRKEMKKDNKARVTTYLNFPGNTEEAFNFYKKVFRGEFSGNGLTRFGDANLPDGHPPMNDADKKLILHAELTILGGHVLMATDAPESMGFKLQTGNNMHINLEPESREETERLFNELSAGGKVSMPLADMFFGAYFGELTDKYGINWMLTYQQK